MRKDESLRSLPTACQVMIDAVGLTVKKILAPAHLK